MTCPIFDIMPIFVSLLLCGLLFVFFNNRMNELKHNNDKNSKVLASLVSEFRNSINRCNPEDCVIRQNNASAVAFNAAKNICKLNSQENIGICFNSDDAQFKNIVVDLKDVNGGVRDSVRDSDRDSDSDSNDGEDSGNDSSDGGDSDSDSNEGEESGNDNSEDGRRGASVVKNKPNETIIQLSNILGNNTLHDIQTVFCVEEKLDTTKIKEVMVNLPELVVGVVTDTPDIESMKVDELKTLAISKNLASPKEIKRMKKNEIVLLFRK